MEGHTANKDDVAMLEESINNLKIGEAKHDTRVQNTGIIYYDMYYVISYICFPSTTLQV